MQDSQIQVQTPYTMVPEALLSFQIQIQKDCIISLVSKHFLATISFYHPQISKWFTKNVFAIEAQFHINIHV